MIQAVAPSIGIEVSPVNVRDPGEIERAVAAFARSGNGGLIVTGKRFDGVASRSDRHCWPRVTTLPRAVDYPRVFHVDRRAA